MTIKRETGLSLTITLFLWLWMDLAGLWVSVVCTYFYFGLEGAPFHLTRIAGVGIISVSGTLIYGNLRRARDEVWGLKILMGSLVLLYLALAFFRDSDLFAWGVLLGNVVCGMVAVALYRRLHALASPDTLFYSAMLGVFAYLGARLWSDGLPAIFRTSSIPIYLILALIGLVMLADNAQASPPRKNRKATPAAQLYAMATGIMIGLNVSMMFNLSLWSAKTPESAAALYFGSFSLGALGGTVIARLLATNANATSALSIVASATTAIGLYVLLYTDHGLVFGLLAHAVACSGSTTLGLLHVRRHWLSATGPDRTVPLLGLTGGAVGFAGAVAYLLLYADPIGFAVALMLVCLVTIAAEIREGRAAPMTASCHSRLIAVEVMVVAFVAASLFVPETTPAAQPSNPADRSELSVMSTNVRYGWTDDYRFEPREHLQWVKEHPADIIGYQEMNKGSFYGSFTDLLAHYRSQIPGRIIYGDASVGFGNALSTWMPIKDSRVVPFASSDMIPRSFIWTLLEFDGQEIEVFVTHLSHLPHPNPVRQDQIGELKDAIGRSSRPWILMGDLNAQPSDPEITELIEISNPVFARKPGLLTEMSHPARVPHARIDYVFFSSDFQLVSQQVMNNGSTSDHRPILSRLRLISALP